LLRPEFPGLAIKKTMKYEIYSGAGNDFVMINNWDNAVPFEQQQQFTVKICDDQFREIDGVIFLDKPLNEGSEIRMNYYNRDGSYGAMCGNGARCTAEFAYSKGIVKEDSFIMEAVDKTYRVDITGEQRVMISFPKGIYFELGLQVDTGDDFEVKMVHWIYAGSEHIVLFIENIINPTVSSLDEADVRNWGSMLRYHPDFQTKGANVNFVKCIEDSKIRIRTYERGVERETLACGTGIVSSAIISHLVAGVLPPVTVLVESGEELVVDFEFNNGIISDVTLEGSAKKIGEGELDIKT
jgi:diaminopimelate epimerase